MGFESGPEAGTSLSQEQQEIREAFETRLTEIKGRLEAVQAVDLSESHEMIEDATRMQDETLAMLQEIRDMENGAALKAKESGIDALALMPEGLEEVKAALVKMKGEIAQQIGLLRRR